MATHSIPLQEQFSNPLFRTLLVTGLGGIIAGFFLGRAFGGLGVAGKGVRGRRRVGEGDCAADSNNNHDHDHDHDHDDDDDDDDESNERAETNGSSLDFRWNEECKLVLVVRTDLGMTKGKIAAQCSHATLACYKALQKSRAASTSSTSSSASHRVLQIWERYGQAKVVVQVKSEEELEVLQARAMSLGLVARIVHDAGRTQIASGSATVLGVGPGPKSIVDGVTGDLKLL